MDFLKIEVGKCQINQMERDERNWFVKMEDTRTKYGGA
jgi:hypothetical protein